MQFDARADGRRRDAGADARGAARAPAGDASGLHPRRASEVAHAVRRRSSATSGRCWSTSRGLPGPELAQAMAGIARIETEAGCDRIARGNPARFQDEAQALLRKRETPAGVAEGSRRLLPDRSTRRSRHSSIPRMLRVASSSRSMAAASRSSATSCGSRFKGTGIRVPLNLEGTEASEPFLRALFGAARGRRARRCLPRRGHAADTVRCDAWIVEVARSACTRCATRGAVTADVRRCARPG